MRRSDRADAARGTLLEKTTEHTNDYFASLLDMGISWTPISEGADVFEGRDRASGKLLWTATRVDLVFVRDFVKAWTKVMNLDRFDVATCRSAAA